MRELILSLCLSVMVVAVFVVMLILGGVIAQEACARGETFRVNDKTYACFEQVTPD